MKRLALLAFTIAVGTTLSCTVGAPPGFSAGTSWSFPLVGPMEDGQLVTAVFINDKGPYLMLIDPDAPMSTVDTAIVSELKLYPSSGPRVIDEGDTTHPARYAEVPSIRIGDLTVTNQVFNVSPVSDFIANGRVMRGVIGRNIIADSLVFGFDRDHGVAYLSTGKTFKPPADAKSISYDLLTNHPAGIDPEALPPPGRRIVAVKVDDATFHVHVDLGDPHNQLRQSLWSKGKLQTVEDKAQLIDEVGTPRNITSAGQGVTASVGPITEDKPAFVPYDDRRWEESDVDGTVGLDFFRNWTVWADWDGEKFVVEPRADVTPSERIARWGATSPLTSCAHPGCVDIAFSDSTPAPAADATPPSAAPGGGAAPGATPPTNRLVVAKRDASAKTVPLDVLVEAVDASGKPMDVPHFVVNFPAGADDASVVVDNAKYGNATFVVLDASPFPRECPGNGSCFMQLQ